MTKSIEYYHRGEWGMRPHPVEDTDESDYVEWLAKGGYHYMTHFGPTGDACGFRLQVYGNGISSTRRERNMSGMAPKYLVDVEMGDNFTKTLAVERLSDLMELLAQWGPLITAAIETDRYRDEIEARITTELANRSRR